MIASKPDRRVTKTKNSIRKAFRELILQKEFSSITITELAALADIDRKTFYLHYTSVEDILKEFEDELADKVMALLKNREHIDISFFFHSLNDIMMEDISLYRRFSAATSYSFFLARCKNILKSSITESFYPKSGISRAYFEVYAEYISSGVISIYTNWLSSEQELSLEELTAAAEDAVYRGWEKIIV